MIQGGDMNQAKPEVMTIGYSLNLHDIIYIVKGGLLRITVRDGLILLIDTSENCVDMIKTYDVGGLTGCIKEIDMRVGSENTEIDE